MNTRKRDRFIEDIISRGKCQPNDVAATFNFAINKEYVDAVSECWEKAKAWDELRPFVEHWAVDKIGSLGLVQMMAKEIINKMNTLIPPEPEKPKTALERLKAWMKFYDGMGWGSIPVVDLKQEIERIEKDEATQP